MHEVNATRLNFLWHFGQARAAVTNALADNLQSRVESLKADIERLHSRQIQLLGANSQQMVRMQHWTLTRQRIPIDYVLVGQLCGRKRRNNLSCRG